MALRFDISDQGAYLKCELLARDSAEETEQFLRAVREAALKHSASRILVSVHSPHAFFRVEKYKLSSYLDELASLPSLKVALVAQHFEVRLLQQYVEVLARLKHANVRSFGDQDEAIRWLRGTQPDGLPQAKAPG